MGAPYKISSSKGTVDTVMKQDMQKQKSREAGAVTHTVSFDMTYFKPIRKNTQPGATKKKKKNSLRNRWIISHN